MRDLLSDEYESVAGHPAEGQLVPVSLRRIGGAALFLGVIGVMGLWSYRLGTRDANEVPVIRALEGPARIAPEDPGGLTAAHQGLEVNSVLAGSEPPAPGATMATPPPVALADEDQPESEMVIAGTPIGPEAGEDGEAGPAPASIRNELAAMVASVAPAAAATPDAAAAPGERPRGRPSNLALARAAAPVAAPVAAAPARPATASAAPRVREVASVAPGARMVQLGAYDSEALARDAWGRLVAREGDLLGARSLYVERATSNARVFYRLRVAGFDDVDETRRTCEALRARGIDCIPVTSH
ncbi:SPOR domain-containing protein [Amaricoccus solimangrovi]|nr:SPOR domain-containing protein [Amaricoccus solimangrovi]